MIPSGSNIPGSNNNNNNNSNSNSNSNINKNLIIIISVLVIVIIGLIIGIYYYKNKEDTSSDTTPTPVTTATPRIRELLNRLPEDVQTQLVSGGGCGHDGTYDCTPNKWDDPYVRQLLDEYVDIDPRMINLETREIRLTDSFQPDISLGEGISSQPEGTYILQALLKDNTINNQNWFIMLNQYFIDTFKIEISTILGVDVSRILVSLIEPSRPSSTPSWEDGMFVVLFALTPDSNGIQYSADNIIERLVTNIDGITIAGYEYIGLKYTSQLMIESSDQLHIIREDPVYCDPTYSYTEYTPCSRVDCNTLNLEPEEEREIPESRSRFIVFNDFVDGECVPTITLNPNKLTCGEWLANPPTLGNRVLSTLEANNLEIERECEYGRSHPDGQLRTIDENTIPYFRVDYYTCEDTTCTGPPIIEDLDCEGHYEENWSECTEECGGGIQYKNWITTRDIQGDGSCIHATTISQPCNLEPCAGIGTCGEWFDQNGDTPQEACGAQWEDYSGLNASGKKAITPIRIPASRDTNGNSIDQCCGQWVAASIKQLDTNNNNRVDCNDICLSKMLRCQEWRLDDPSLIPPGGTEEDSLFYNAIPQNLEQNQIQAYKSQSLFQITEPLIYDKYLEHSELLSKHNSLGERDFEVSFLGGPYTRSDWVEGSGETAIDNPVTEDVWNQSNNLQYRRNNFVSKRFDNINWVPVCDSDTDPDNLGCLLEDGNIMPFIRLNGAPSDKQGTLTYELFSQIYDSPDSDKIMNCEKNLPVNGSAVVNVEAQTLQQETENPADYRNFGLCSCLGN